MSSQRPRPPSLLLPLRLLILLLPLLLCFSSSAPDLTIAAAPPTSPPPPASNRTVQLAVLLALKASISSDPTGVFASWNASSDFCTWQGVLCSSDNVNPQVRALILDSRQLNGTLPARLTQLQGLSYLNVSNNSFHGPIPPQLGELAATLTHFDLSRNEFSGSIPASLARCTLLIYVDLNANSLTGSFPAYIANFTQLGYLDLSSNEITGQLPTDIGLLSASLQFFQVYSTLLTGSIPTSLTNCSNLVWLNLASTFLSGSLPSDWTKPASTLQQLKLEESNFSGGIPSTLGNCTVLTFLRLENNSLTGEIPASFGKLSRLQDLQLYHNHLSGPIPPSLMNCTHLLFLELSDNNLSGVIPKDLGQLTLVAEWISLSGNPLLEGPIPDSIGRCAQLQVLSLYETAMGGSLPSSLFNLTHLQRLSLQQCRFWGRLSGLVGQLTSLSNSLDLSHNAFEGPIPAELAQLKSLQGLHLQANNFDGHIPHQLSGLSSISEMNLSSNPISGPIPSSFARLSSLNKFSIRNTRISGPIPDIFGGFKRLEVVDLAHNMLAGPIPTSLAALNTLSITLDLSSNRLTGEIPSSIGGMVKLQVMHLSGNSFSGEIPAALGDCVGMQVLDLSQNRLGGGIPDAFGQMESLQYLDLSQNGLSGTLPPSLGLLDSLVSLNVSYNELEGMIPGKGVYQKSSEFSFVGNRGLCGYPSSTTCGTLHTDHATRKVVIIVSVCVAGGALLAVFFCFCSWRWFCKSDNKDAIEETEQESPFDMETPWVKAWTAKELRAATDNFDAANVVGFGAVSTCYKGVTENRLNGAKMQRVVAVKRLNVRDADGMAAEARRSFVAELKTICKVRHRNLVKVVGYCVEGGEVALVMEYMEGGDLDGHLHGAGKGRLSWEERLNVAVDVAEGLFYLHHETVQPIIHCDLKPKNILLNTDRTAKISDFGIAKLLEIKQGADLTISEFRGSFGYAAPECAAGTRISTKADVYSYGVLLLELLTGLRPTSSQLQGMTLHVWAHTHQQSGRAVEEALRADAGVAEEAGELLALALRCSREVVAERPTMHDVRDFLIHLKKQKLAAARSR